MRRAEHQRRSRLLWNHLEDFVRLLHRCGRIGLQKSRGVSQRHFERAVRLGAGLHCLP